MNPQKDYYGAGYSAEGSQRERNSEALGQRDPSLSGLRARPARLRPAPGFDL